ncbi:MAG: branched-chain amino acid ABC transporter permease, partial [Rhodobacterales bacterium]|nr:branched-chain amino acid ABC transporter permease [Rhodobacterales bacterium]
MTELVTILLDASNYVLILMLVALGLAIIFGLMNVINMAHGEFLMLGAYAVLMVQDAGGSYWLGLVAAPVVVGAVGLVVEELVIRHIYHRFLDTILATWGLSLLLKQGIILIHGPGAYAVAAPMEATVDVLGAPYPLFRLFIMGVAVATVAFTFWLFFRTRFGLAA